MGILRTDRVSGLGGANAIKGSVFFDGASTITVEDSDDFTYGSGAFTIEGWIFATGRDQQMMLLGQWDGSGSVAGSLAWAVQLTNDTNGFLRFLTSSSGTNVVLNQNGTAGSVFDDKWHHFAVTRHSNDYKLFMDGVVVGSVTDSTSITNGAFPLTIGGSNRLYSSGSSSSQTFTGFLSNIRIIKGEALYTAAFTPPISELTVTSKTVLLACQSSNILREETGKILSIDKSSTNDSGPIASKFTPNSPVGFSTTTDVGTQFGSTFDGVTTFDSQAYMVPPGGNTRERNRGRGVLGGGAPFVSPNVINNMSFVQVQSQGNFQDFGDLTVSRGQFPAGQNASSTRGLSSGGWTSPVGVNTIDFITISNTANATDFGDTSIARPNGVLSNQTRSLTASNGDIVNTIDFVTIATAGNASDFGDLLFAIGLTSGVSSPTRGVFGGGRTTSPSNVEYNTLQFITIASTGNAQDFGDLTRTRYGSSGFSSPTRGIFAGGYSNPQGKFEGIEFITIATLGNGTDFGDLSASQGYGGSLTNSILGLITINSPSNYYNTIEFITITTTGNAKDFGDADPLGSGKGHGSFPSCMSDSHGGIE